MDRAREIAGYQDRWMTIEADAALYADRGLNTILCDRLARPITLVLKNPVHRDGISFPSDVVGGFRTSLADRGGKSAAILKEQDNGE